MKDSEEYNNMDNNKPSTNSESDKESKDELNENKKEDNISISVKDVRYPYCIVWTQIPMLSYIMPCIGHTGIGNTNGIIYDFAGSFTVSVNDMAFGNPLKYVKLNLNEEEKRLFDSSILDITEQYKKKEHQYCGDNCHTFVAEILNKINYKGKNDYTKESVFNLVNCHSEYISCTACIKNYFGFFIFLLILGAFIVGIYFAINSK